MTKTFLTIALSFFLLHLSAQDAKTIELSVRNDSEIQITDTKKFNSKNSETEKSFGYTLELTGKIISFSKGTVKIQFTPNDFTFKMKDKKGNTTYNSADENFYLKKKKALVASAFVMEYNNTPNFKGEIKQGKGEDGLVEKLKDMVNPEFHSEVGQLFETSYGQDLIKRIIPLKNNTLVAMDSDLGFPLTKDKSNLEHLISKELKLTPKLIKPAFTSISQEMNVTENITDPSSGFTSTVVTVLTGDINVSFKTGLLNSSNETTKSQITSRNNKNEVLEESEETVVRIFSVGSIN
ncbi:MAG: hypothetical protein AB8B53_04185 [Flavobacteriales bacterium]